MRDLDDPDAPGDAAESSGILPVPVPADALETGFVPEQRLADLLFRKRVRRVGPGLVLSGGRGYQLCEAIRVIGRADGGSDPYGLSGTVEAMAELVRAGASFAGATMRVGRTVYRVERGVLAVAQPRGEDDPDTLAE
jgi:hypothetical protein